MEKIFGELYYAYVYNIIFYVCRSILKLEKKSAK